jgi:hypothetical protein
MGPLRWAAAPRSARPPSVSAAATSPSARMELLLHRWRIGRRRGRVDGGLEARAIRLAFDDEVVGGVLEAIDRALREEHVRGDEEPDVARVSLPGGAPRSSRLVRPHPSRPDGRATRPPSRPSTIESRGVKTRWPGRHGGGKDQRHGSSRKASRWPVPLASAGRFRLSCGESGRSRGCWIGWGGWAGTLLRLILCRAATHARKSAAERGPVASPGVTPTWSPCRPTSGSP